MTMKIDDQKHLLKRKITKPQRLWNGFLQAAVLIIYFYQKLYYLFKKYTFEFKTSRLDSIYHFKEEIWVLK